MPTLDDGARAPAVSDESVGRGGEGLADKRVLVTGAAGLVGGALTLRLASLGARVRALVHRASQSAFLRDRADVQVLTGDITDQHAMRLATHGCDYIFHAAASLMGPLAQQRRVNVDGTRRLMRTAAEAGVQRVVHISTISVYGFRLGHDVDEYTPLRPGPNPYALTKAEAEGVVREMGARHNLSYAIIRPGNIYGPRARYYTETLFRITQCRCVGKPRQVWFGPGDGLSHYIHIDDVVDMLLLLATHPAAHWEAFHCTPDPSPPWREVLREYALLTSGISGNVAPPLLMLPTGLLTALAWGTELGRRVIDSRWDLPAVAHHVLANHVTYLMGKAQRELGWRPRVDLRVGVASCAPWLRERGLLR